jgi:hypothetical protein
MNTYLINPWVFTSMVAAFILLVAAALLQTVYTVVPFYFIKTQGLFINFTLRRGIFES